jgi:DHA1 family tetracycline resistance protein-like MFS transporter
MAIFLDLICNGIMVPIVPQLLANPNSPYYLLPSNPDSPYYWLLSFMHVSQVSYGYIILGILIAVYPIAMFFSSPILGEYSDFVGRRKIMALSLTGSAISLAFFAFGIYSRSLTILFVARIFGGIMGGNLSVAQAAIADITPPKLRASRFGLIGAAYGVGFIVGPVIGGVLADSNLVSWFNASTPFLLAALISIINAILVFILMGETRNSIGPFVITWTKAIRDIFHAYGMKKIRMIFVSNFLFQSGLTLFATFFSVFLISGFHFNQTEIGYYIGFVGIWAIVSQGVLLRILSKRFDEFLLLRIFLLLGSAAMFAFYIPDHVVGLLIVGALFALTNGVNMALLPSIVSRRSPANVQGEILGINASVQALAQTAPPIVAGFMAAEISPSAPVYIAGGVIGLGWIIFMVFVKKEAE